MGPMCAGLLLALWLCALPPALHAAAPETTQERWIRPADVHAPPVWGIRGGIVFSLWPDDLETGWPRERNRPRGLIRIGREQDGMVYLINFVAIEPMVNGKVEYSEISPSRVDGRWGKLMWAGDTAKPGGYAPYALTRGTLTRPDPSDPDVEELSLHVFMEPFANGAHPYLRLSIRSDRPDEIGFQVFDHEGSTPMQRCTLTATMGNYARARLLHLRDRVVDARELYAGYDGIGFVEKEPYPADAMQRTPEGGLIAAISGDEAFAELSAWPQSPAYRQRWGWRWRPFFTVTQYWRKPAGDAGPSLHVRVNGRARYWATGSRNPADYVGIPGGVSFENFELREDYRRGQRFHFGITRKGPEELIAP